VVGEKFAREGKTSHPGAKEGKREGDSAQDMSPGEMGEKRCKKPYGERSNKIGGELVRDTHEDIYFQKKG